MLITRVRYRMAQFASYLLPAPVAGVDAELRAYLTPAEWRLVARLAPGDRRHLLAVYHRLRARGCADPDLLKAALLHDVGKADGIARVRLPDRVVVVLLRRFAPDLLHRLAQPGRARWRHRLYLALEHPRLGAALARMAGCSPRVCWLIAHHHDAALARDQALAILRVVDEEL